MRVTIKDVARVSGLSISTVSRAINHSGYVGQDTQERIERVIEELEYRPNWMAQSLKGKPSYLVGLIIPDISNVYYTAIAQKVSATLRQRNYDLILCVSNEDPALDLGYLKMLREKRVDGIIYVHPSRGDNSSYVRQLVEDGLPVIELNRRRDQDFLDAVLADNRQGGFQATRHLIRLGHRRIGLIMGETTMETGAKRLAGYRDALEGAGIPFCPELVQLGNFSRQHGEHGMQALLSLPEPPSAVFAGSNRILAGVLIVLGQASIVVPDELSLVAFDDAEWLSIWKPPITVVDIAIEEIARLSVDLLYRRISGIEKSVKTVAYLLSTNLIERGSCQKFIK